MMAARYLQESRSVLVVNTNDGNSMADEEFYRHISQLPIVIVPGTQNNYLYSYTETGMPVLNLVQGIRAIPAERQAIIISKIMSTVHSVAGESSLVAVSTSEALTRAQVIAGKVAPIAIVGVQLSWEALKSIRSWWQGEITGKRCAKQIVDASAGILGGYAGGAAGMALGTAILPGYGTLCGAVVGGFAGSVGASALMQWLTEYFFDVPKSVSVENAYNFLTLPLSCSNDEINRRYRTLALQYHPDKGGNAADFHKLQISVAIIKQARGQYISRHLDRLEYVNCLPLNTPMLTEEHKERRIEWAKQYLNDDWKAAIFTDESSFQLFRNTIRRWSK
ncbi:unnamed protein product [Rotaria socialis]|uniref:J domain-containing protein n=2 Tax=Rotaria socialis TaxID=392032 RepID=A0A821IJH7_9BILA|nr:unnamed protein product [Rotaria socialis]CAF4702151.1 unnamed protein product [Rotaria socialis]